MLQTLGFIRIVLAFWGLLKYTVRSSALRFRISVIIINVVYEKGLPSYGQAFAGAWL